MITIPLMELALPIAAWNTPRYLGKHNFEVVYIWHPKALSFGLVHIPISLHNANRDNDIRFNQLHKTDHL